MQKKIFFTMTFLFFSLTVVFSQQSNLVEKVGMGYIDWAEGKIKMRGQGAPPTSSENIAQARLMAERAAKMQAMANFLEVIKGVRIDSETTISDLGVENKIVSRVEGYVKNFAVAKTGYLSDASVYVDIVFDLYGQNGLSSAIFPTIFTTTDAEVGESAIISKLKEEIEKLKMLILGLEKRVENLELRPQGKASLPEKKETTLYTGLIIDATGIELKPAMSPKVTTEDGKEIYNRENANQDYAMKIGLVGYAKSIDDAKNLKRVGELPLVVKAIDVSGSYKTNPVISKQDARKISQNKDIFNNCAVVFVVN